MKKIFKLFSLFLFLFFITSCNLQNNNKEYRINYIVEGVLVETTSYKTGDDVELYVYPIDSVYDVVFDGWYDNPNYTGQKVIGIGKDSSSDITLYGRVLDNTSNSLENALRISNYTVDIKDSISNSVLTCKFDETKKMFSSVDFGDYAYYYLSVPDMDMVIYNYNNKWFSSNHGENVYNAYIEYFNLFSIDNINASYFEETSTKGVFKCKEEYLDETIAALNNNYEASECKEFMIYLNSNTLKLEKIEFSIVEIELTKYTITFKDIDNTNITIPDYTYDNGIMGGIQDQTGIDELHELYNGADATAIGVVTGVYGNNFYLTDNSGSILVYCGNDSMYLPIIEDGKVIKVKGSISIYKDIAQIIDLTEVSVVEQNIKVTATSLSSISQSALSALPAEYVNVKKATLLSIPTYSTTSDMSFEIRYNNEDVTVFISRHLGYTYKNALVDSLEKIGVNGKIDLNNLHVSKYNEYQLVCTSVSSFNKNTDGLVLTEVIATPKSISVVEGTTIEEILEKITLEKVYDDGTSEVLSNEECFNSTDFVYNQVGKYTIQFNYKTLSIWVNVEVVEKGAGYITTNITEPINKQTARNFDLTTGLPSIGNPKVLVIPVSFIDYPASNSIVTDLEKAFFGTSEETGWESLQSYYYKSSYGKLNITGTVLQPYKTNNYASYYDNYEDADYMMIKAALEYYNDQINYADYDTDNDGYIDSIYIVYTRNYDDAGNSNWWAYTYEYSTEDYELYDGVEADFYTFMSIDFLNDELQGKKVKYNAETIIHETGHLLGLDDYYDYTEGTGPDGGIGGGDMMDYNVGDHNAFSKLLLGWVNPYVLTGVDVTITLSSFASSGECIIVPKNWNGSFYSEYFIIDYYTPTNLNEFAKGESGLFATYGIRIYHINAALKSYNDALIIYSMTKYDNSDTTYRLISLVEADGRDDIGNSGWSEDSDLFKVGDIYSTAKWYNNTSAQFKMKVNSIITTTNNEKAEVTFTFN